MAKIKIDGFKLYKKTDDGDVFVADIEKTVRTKEFFRTMAIGTYGISAYRVVADVIDPSKSSVVESIKRYFDVNPFYRVIIKDTITETDKVTVTWTNETNINYIDGYEVFRVNETESGMTYELVDTITSPEATEYVFMRDDDTTYTYVISPKTYEGFHDADSSYIEVMFASIPPVMLIEPTDAVIYTARWKYDGDDGYDPEHDWEPEPDPIELPANTFRFQWENPIDNPATDARFTLTQVDDRTWDYTVKDAYLNTGGIFDEKFNDLNNKVKLIAVGDISGIIDMYSMFHGCTSLTTVPLFDTSNVTNMLGMFYGCTSLTTVPLFDTSNVTDMAAMFNNCTSLTSVPLFDTSKVITMDAMFWGCTSLTTVPLFDTSNVIMIGDMFHDCTKVESGALALYRQASATGKVTLYGNTFTNCGIDTETGLAELQRIPEDWGGLACNVVIDGLEYDYVVAGNLLWTSSNFAGSSFEHVTVDGINYYRYDQIAKINASLSGGWRIPTIADKDYMRKFIGYDGSNGKLWTGKKLLAESAGGLDEYGIGLTLDGYCYNGKVERKGIVCDIALIDNMHEQFRVRGSDGAILSGESWTDNESLRKSVYFTVRFVKDK